MSIIKCDLCGRNTQATKCDSCAKEVQTELAKKVVHAKKALAALRNKVSDVGLQAYIDTALDELNHEEIPA